MLVLPQRKPGASSGGRIAVAIRRSGPHHLPQMLELGPILQFLKAILGPLLKLGLDGLDAFVVIALFVLAGGLFKLGMDQYLVAGLCAILGLAYFHRRERSDAHKERLAAMKVEDIERRRGDAVRSKARKRLAKEPPTSIESGHKRDGSNARS